MLSPTQLMPKTQAATLKKAEWRKLTQPLLWYGNIVPPGAEYKTFVTKNFGWVVLREAVGGRKLYKY